MYPSRSNTSASASLKTPFKQQQLRQFRAQCAVFLAFKNNLMARKLHLEIALGGNYPREGQLVIQEQQGCSYAGSVTETASSSKEHAYVLPSKEKEETRIECTGQILAQDLGGLKPGSIVDDVKADNANNLASPTVMVCSSDSTTQRQPDPEPRQGEAKQAERVEKAYVEQSEESERECSLCSKLHGRTTNF